MIVYKIGFIIWTATQFSCGSLNQWSETETSSKNPRSKLEDQDLKICQNFSKNIQKNTITNSNLKFFELLLFFLPLLVFSFIPHLESRQKKHVEW